MTGAEMYQAYKEREDRRSELWKALVTRALTDEELVEVVSHGVYIAIPMVYEGNGCSVSRFSNNRLETLQEIQNALLIQQMLRGKK